jgi:GTP cyclohydrolase II
VIKSHLSQPIQQAIQVTRELNFTSQEREVGGLLQAMKKFGLSEGYILTYNQEEEREES